MATPIETFPALAAIPGFTHGFLVRDTEVDTQTTDKAEALARLEGSHRTAWQSLGFNALWTAEQVHGAEIRSVDDTEPSEISGVDGLITTTRAPLGIYVADCCAIFIVDPVNQAHALVHSGRKGSELGIAPLAIRRLIADHGSQPTDIVVQLSPCVRPPIYEIDFAKTIRETCAAEGVPQENIHDSRTCTGSHLERYYSYRVEKGATGRMLAVAGFLNN